MAVLAEKLENLETRMAQKATLRRKLDRLNNELRALEERCRKAQFAMEQAQEEVAQMEKRSPKNMWYRVIGKLREKRMEKQETAWRYGEEWQILCAQRSAACKEIEALRKQQLELADCEREYTAMMEAGRKKLLETPGPALEEYSALRGKMAAQESRRKELREAMQAASRAEATVETLLDSLKNAKGWSTWDAVGGGLETDFIKYRKMENAQSIADTLSSQLSALRDELSDLDNAGELAIRVEGFVRFADWFFDDFISAWCVRSKICDSIDQAEAVKYRLEQLNRRLQESFDDSQKRTRTLQRECDAAVREFISQQEQAG
ncbi:MAG TPA: hypothetical protein IAA80_05920 [Candidatus Gallacutalibacter pullistercoris]|nr:hypothetical protein [Candidatus Gallacutalibacter pullistercoris]